MYAVIYICAHRVLHLCAAFAVADIPEKCIFRERLLWIKNFITFNECGKGFDNETHAWADAG